MGRIRSPVGRCDIASSLGIGREGGVSIDRTYVGKGPDIRYYVDNERGCGGERKSSYRGSGGLVMVVPLLGEMTGDCSNEDVVVLSLPPWPMT